VCWPEEPTCPEGWVSDAELCISQGFANNSTRTRRNLETVTTLAGPAARRLVMTISKHEICHSLTEKGCKFHFNRRILRQYKLNGHSFYIKLIQYICSTNVIYIRLDYN
ncbi:unnamed protein product, partial [Fusarium graminearum]